jgi:hypothetical protein
MQGAHGLVHLELGKVSAALGSVTFDLEECISVLRTRLDRSIDSPLPSAAGSTIGVL